MTRWGVSVGLHMPTYQVGLSMVDKGDTLKALVVHQFAVDRAVAVEAVRKVCSPLRRNSCHHRL